MTWVYIVIAFIGGYAVGLITAAILSGTFDRVAEERERQLVEMGLIYPKNEKDPPARQR